MTDRFILIVDDDPSVSDAIKDVLEDEGHRVAVAYHGAEALDCLRAGTRPDLVLLDHMMPVMDGPAFAAAVEQDPALRGLKIVLLTADGRASAKATEMGLDVFLTKPVQLDRLLEVISNS